MAEIKEYWHLIVAGIGALLWLARLEARSVRNTAEIERLWKQRHEDLEVAADARKENREALQTIQSDIKKLLAKVGDR